MRFAGVDLAWSPRNPSAVALLEWSDHSASLSKWRCDLQGDEDIASYVARGRRQVVAAIDGPLIVPNVSGIRACDAEVNAAYRRFNAGVHPANRTNLGRYGGLRGEGIVGLLGARGIPLAVPTVPRARSGGCFECYPHAALVSLFQLPRILEYKARGLRRPFEVRQEAFHHLQDLLASLSTSEPPLDLPRSILERELEGMSGRELKAYEDILDSIVCAYIALHAWYWGPSGYRLYGDLQRGHILVPCPPTRQDGPQSIPGSGVAKAGPSGPHHRGLRGPATPASPRPVPRTPR